MPSREYPLVYVFSDQLCPGGFSGPEPDFLTWAAEALSPDTGTCYDNYTDEQLGQAERDAWRLYHDAIAATESLLGLYRENPKLLLMISREMNFLPCLMSWHPDNEQFNRKFYEFAQLGQRGMYGELRKNAKHLARQPWPVRYAYAVISTINLNQDCYGERLNELAECYGYGIRNPFTTEEIELALANMKVSEDRKKEIREENRGAYRILPKWTKQLPAIRQPITPRNAVDYWRLGKEIILEDMPDFHERPEWKEYRSRKYIGGAKRGSIQHAIFKDILTALRTIAGANKKTAVKRRPKT